MRYVITTPEPLWTGEVAGVAFAHGRGLADDPPARVINYFKRKGYGVENLDADKSDDAVVSEGASAPGGGGSDELQHMPGTSVGADASEGDNGDKAESKKTATRRSTTNKGADQ